MFIPGVFWSFLLQHCQLVWRRFTWWHFKWCEDNNYISFNLICDKESHVYLKQLLCACRLVYIISMPPQMNYYTLLVLSGIWGSKYWYLSYTVSVVSWRVPVFDVFLSFFRNLMPLLRLLSFEDCVAWWDNRTSGHYQVCLINFAKHVSVFFSNVLWDSTCLP